MKRDKRGEGGTDCWEKTALWVVGTIMLAEGASKVLTPMWLGKIFPGGGGVVVAGSYWLPWFELILGIGLFTRWRKGAGALTGGLLLSFCFYLFYAIAAGEQECGCGFVNMAPEGALARNALMLIGIWFGLRKTGLS